MADAGHLRCTRNQYESNEKRENEGALSMNSGFVRAVSQALNKVIFGARVASDRDAMSQWSTIGTGYVLNFLLTFMFVAVISAILGYYDPLNAPLATPA